MAANCTVLDLPASSTVQPAHGNAPLQGDVGNGSPIRVCYMIDRLASGGTELQLLTLVNHLDRRKVVPLLCLLDGLDDVSKAMEPADCQVYRLGVKSLSRPRAWRAIWRLSRILRRERVDVLQVQFADSTSLAVAAGWLAGVPCVVRTRRDLEYWKTARQKRYGRRLDGIYNRFRVDAMVTNSNACREAVLQSEFPPPRRIEIIPNGVVLSRFDAKPVSELTSAVSAGPTVGIVAMLRPEKRLDLFAEAAALVAERHPNTRFCIVGEGKQRPSLVALTEQLGLGGRLELMGKSTNVPDFLSRVEVAVLCSDSEGLPNAVLEYMAAGKAIVATNVGGTPELIDDEVNGLLVPRGDKQRLADAICRVLEDSALAARLSRAARERSLAFGVPAMLQRYESLYEDLLAKTRRRRLGQCVSINQSVDNRNGR